MGPLESDRLPDAPDGDDGSTLFSRENPDTPPLLSPSDEAVCDAVVAREARDPRNLRHLSMLDILNVVSR